MRNHRYILFLWLLLVAFCQVSAKSWRPEDVPMVHLEDKQRYVCNPDGILSSTAVDSADAVLLGLERDKGVQSVVVVVERMESGDAYQFGREIFLKYGVGSKEQNSGFVLVLSTGDRKYYLLTGTGLEGTLPDALCKRIENRVMVPELKAGNWDAAILGAVKSIDGVVRGDETLKADLQQEEEGSGAFGLLVFAAVFALLFVLLAAGRSSRSCPVCKSHTMRCLERKRFRQNGRWKIHSVWQCSHCGHTESHIEDDHSNTSGYGGTFVPPVIFSSGRGGSFGGGSFGGSFGGGSFGGGGAGGSF